MVSSVGLGVGGMGMMQGIPDPINALQTLARQGTPSSLNVICLTVETQQLCKCTQILLHSSSFLRLLLDVKQYSFCSVFHR